MTQYVFGACGYALLITEKSELFGFDFFREVTDKQAETLASRFANMGSFHHSQLDLLLEG